MATETTELRSRGMIASREAGRNVDFLDVSLVLARSWRTILIVTIALAIAGGAISFLLPKTYTATAIIIPPQQQQSVASAMIGELGSLAGLASGSSSGGGASLFKNPGELYVGVLKSRTIADKLIDQFHLKSIYHAKTMTDARTKLKGDTKFEAAKDGLILINVTDHDPGRASDIANGYVDELYHLNSNLAITEAAQRRVFFDQELVNEKAALNQAEDDLENIQRKTGVIVLSGQTQEMIVSIAQLRAGIASREVQIQSLKSMYTDQNPDIIRAQREIDSMRDELAKLENNRSKLPPGDIQVPSGQMPEAALEYERGLREVRYHQALFELLSKQYEAARIDEAKSAPLIQVIDRAVPPDKKSGPHRLLIALGSGLLGLLGTCGWFMMRNGFRRMKEVPENAERLDKLRQEFRRA